jgi:hypothetical protein
MFAASKSGSADAKDANFKNVTMLLHGNGTNGAQNNTFVDSSTNNFSITRNGNTTQGTFSPYGANWSNYFDGSGDTLNTASNAAFGFGSGAWTFEAWVYPTTSQTDNWIIATNDAGKLRMRVGASGYLSFYTDTGSVSLNSTTVVTVNAWSHVAICYDGTTLSLYQNGTRTATSTVSISNGSANSCYIGSNTVGGGYWNGYISNARVVKGSAVYSGATYTVPTTPLTAISGTSLLTCADNRFIDDSTNNFAITKNGDVSVQRFSPFNATSAYSTSVIGGSGYFDGSGDYLSLPSNSAFAFGTGDFTVDGWVYSTSTGSASKTIFNTGGSGNNFSVYLTSTNQLNYVVELVTATGGGTVPLNTWTHIACSRSSGTIRLFINGTQVYSGSETSSISQSAPNVSSSTYPFFGYMSNIRVVKGTAVYTSAFTPPTAPVTAITNTVLLLDFTNAGVLDNAMMNDLETVGNAQISTSVKKYGTGSIAFDGSGDWLNAISSPNYGYGSGDFTIEFWAYPTSSSGVQVFLDQRTGSSTSAVPTIYTSSGTIYYYTSGSNRITGSSLSLNQWSHIAICRSGTSTKMFINGTQSGSTFTDTTTYLNAPVRVGDGNDGAGPYPFSGYIDDFRITKGFARYTANFTAPTAAFADKG